MSSRPAGLNLARSFSARPGSPALLAHRGGMAGIETENSRAAFRRALTLGADGLETDVHVTKDNVVMILHDPILESTTNFHGRIEDYEWAQLRAARLRGGEPLLTLEEFLDSFPEIFVNIDVKTDRALEPFKRVLAGRDDLERLTLGCFSDSRMDNLRSHFGSSLSYGATPREIAKLVAGVKLRLPARFMGLPKLQKMGVVLEVPAFEYGLEVVSARFVKIAHEWGLPVFVWTINEGAEYLRLAELGVDAVFTDNLPLLQGYAAL